MCKTSSKYKFKSLSCAATARQPQIICRDLSLHDEQGNADHHSSSGSNTDSLDTVTMRLLPHRHPSRAYLDVNDNCTLGQQAYKHIAHERRTTTELAPQRPSALSYVLYRGRTPLTSPSSTFKMYTKQHSSKYTGEFTRQSQTPIGNEAILS